MSQKTRSKLVIDAVAQAAALAPTGAVAALSPLSKVKAIAGLAGFVLRLCRSREPLPPLTRAGSGGARKRPARIQQGSSQAVRSQSGSKGGSYHG